MIPPEDLQAIAKAVRREHAADLIEERISAHWSTLAPSPDDENLVISAALSGHMAPIETGIPRAAFTGHRWRIWQAIELHYGQADGFEAPDLEELTRWIHASGVRGPVLQELLTLRDEMPFLVESEVLSAAARLVESHRARELCAALERVVLRLHAGAPVGEVKGELRRLTDG